MYFISYDRKKAVEYAGKWYNKRNSAYLNFDGIGGDCTNFASQCLFAGTGVMNYRRDTGWYYNSPNDRAAAWSGSSYLIKFLLNNSGEGPVGEPGELYRLEIGDLIFLSNSAEYYHTLVVTGFSKEVPLVAAHTDDSFMRNLNTYYYDFATGVHILGAQKY
ncbi:MAG: amidase domain-containing protein [Eubacterium sp.]